MRRRFELEPGEAIVDEWVAGIPSSSGRTCLYGGSLILTTNRLIWEAVRLPPGVDRTVGGMFLESMMDGVALADVTGARAAEERGMILHIDSTEGETRLLVSASRWSPLWSKKNQVARDAAVARIRGAIGG